MKRMYGILFIGFFYVFTLFIQCNKSQNTEPQFPISDEEFMHLYSDLMIIKNTKTPSAETDSMIINVYNKYNITKATYEQVEQYFMSNPDRWLEILEKVGKHIQNYADRDSSRQDYYK